MQDSGLNSTTPARQERFLIACHNLILAGGLLRFKKLGAVLRNWGHEVAFCTLADDSVPNEWQSALRVLSLDQALAARWDAVMVPGAGFLDATIEKFVVFRQDNFGVRVQHILNDQSRRSWFKKVNQSLAPHVVLFNNLHWPVGSFTDFEADRFHVLLGAVDTTTFRLRTDRSHPLTAKKWIVGGLASKNPQPLIEALMELPQEVVLRLFGPDSNRLADVHRDLIEAGRLELTGPLLDEDLSRFYHSLDCVAMTETFAGWSNLAAEAMASGVPVVCTPHGTTAFARHEETALVMDTPTPATIANGLRRLMCDASLRQRLIEEARETISTYSWENYGRQMLELIKHDGHRHYMHAPEVGLYGKWPLEQRLCGLQPLLEQCRGMSVIDLSAAEGMISREFLKHGAARVDGFDIDPHRVKIANALCALWSSAIFSVADLSDWDTFHRSQAGVIDEAYDIVLYLGIHHHLPAGKRQRTLKYAVRLARRYFAIRTPGTIYNSDNIDDLLKDEGFGRLEVAMDSPQPENLGVLAIYVRRQIEGR